jgi:serine/threonine protein phosphatase PrpC
MLSHNATNHYIKQAISEQDFATSELSESGSFHFVVIADTHGKTKYGTKYDHRLKNLFQEMDWKTVLQDDTFFEDIQEEIKKIDTLRIGSTLSICKIFEDRFEIYWAGDSTIKIYNNDDEIWRTKDHDKNNENEKLRLKELSTFIKHRDGKDVEVVDDDTIKQFISPVFYFGDIYEPDTVNMTHALGHNQNTGDFISHETVSRNHELSYKVVAGSDGFWQMTSNQDTPFIASRENTSQTLVEFADKRWKQLWKFISLDEGTHEGVTFPAHNIDDIAIACWND